MTTREELRETFLGSGKGSAIEARSLIRLGTEGLSPPGMRSFRCYMPKKLDEKAKKLLEGKNVVFVATVNKDGTPHLTPTWVDTDGENVLINSALGRKKVRNLEKDARVTVGVYDLSNPYEHLSIEGRVVKQITGEEADAHIDKMAKKYTGQDKYPWRSPGEKRVLLVIEPIKTY